MLSIPAEVQMELCGVCNLVCPYCTWQQRTAGRQHMDTALALALIREAAALRVPLLTFHGVGESTMHPDFPVILAAAWGAGLTARLSTNCLTLSGETAQLLGRMDNLELTLALHHGIPEAVQKKCEAHALDYLASSPKNRELLVLVVCTEDAAHDAARVVDVFLPVVERMPRAMIFFKQPQTWPKASPQKGAIPDLPAHPRIRLDRTVTPLSLGRDCRMPEYLLNVLADGSCTPCCVGQDDWGLPNAKEGLANVWGSLRRQEVLHLWRGANDSVPCGFCLKRTDC